MWPTEGTISDKLGVDDSEELSATGRTARGRSGLPVDGQECLQCRVETVCDNGGRFVGSFCLPFALGFDQVLGPRGVCATPSTPLLICRLRQNPGESRPLSQLRGICESFMRRLARREFFHASPQNMPRRLLRVVMDVGRRRQNCARVEVLRSMDSSAVG